MKISFYLIIISCFSAINAYAYTQSECIGCHSHETGNSRFQISIQDFSDSVHGGEIACVDCHSGIEGPEHQDIKGAGKVDCNQCHDQDNRHGINGEAKDRPRCYTCHGKHYILGKNNMASAVHGDQLKFTCRKCHPVQWGEVDIISRLPLLRIRSHKKQDFSRDYQRTNCIGCHQGMAAHGEDEFLDSQDCHQCHMDLGEHGWITGHIHPGADNKNQMTAIIVPVAYIMFILVFLGFAFKYLGSCVIKKTGKNRE